MSLTCRYDRAAYRNRTDDLRITRGPLPGRAPASCTDSTDHRTDGTRRAGTIQGPGNPSRGGIELKLADFYAQGWNAHLVGLISPDPEETLGEDLAILAPLVADGRLAPHIGLTLGWEETPRAFAALAGRTLRGKAVLTRR